MKIEEDVQFTAGEIEFILHRLRKLKAAISNDLHESHSNDSSLGKLQGICNSIDIIGNVLSHGKDYRIIKGRERVFEEPIQQILLISENPSGISGFQLCQESKANDSMQALVDCGDIVTRFWVIDDDQQKFTVYKRLKAQEETS